MSSIKGKGWDVVKKMDEMVYLRRSNGLNKRGAAEDALCTTADNVHINIFCS